MKHVVIEVNEIHISAVQTSVSSTALSPFELVNTAVVRLCTYGSLLLCLHVILKTHFEDAQFKNRVFYSSETFSAAGKIGLYCVILRQNCMVRKLTSLELSKQ